MGVASLVLATAVATSIPYPSQRVWDAFVSFCTSEQPRKVGWSVFNATMEPALEYIVEDPRKAITGLEYKDATVYRRFVRGRKLFALHQRHAQSRHCKMYDFDARETLHISDWSKIAGAVAKDSPKLTQAFDFGPSAVPGHSLGGKIILHQPGYFPPLHSIGFVGLQFFAISKDPV